MSRPWDTYNDDDLRLALDWAHRWGSHLAGKLLEENPFPRKSAITLLTNRYPGFEIPDPRDADPEQVEPKHQRGIWGSDGVYVCGHRFEEETEWCQQCSPRSVTSTPGPSDLMNGWKKEGTGHSCSDAGIRCSIRRG